MVDNKAPPVEASYHLNVPDVGEVAVNVTVPLPHRSTALATGAAGDELIVAVTAVLPLLKQVPSSNST